MADDAAAKRRRTCIGEGGGGGFSALPEHVLHGIFSRVGSFKDLFMFAVTCRRWLRRFTDPAFLRELCPNQGEGHRARLLGCFLQRTGFDDPPQWQITVEAPGTPSAFAAPTTFLPGPGWPFGPTARALTSFVSDDGDGGTFNYAKPLSARRGILLLRLSPSTSQETSCHLFALCNPVTGERHVLPPLQWSIAGSHLSTYAIITAADRSSNHDGNNGKPPPPSLSGSQLLVTARHDTIGFEDLHSYSAATRSWSPPTMFMDGLRFTLLGERSAVVHRGAAHWLCVDDRVPGRKRAPPGGGQGESLHKLSVELATSRVSLTKLPVRVGGRTFLCVNGDGELAVAAVYPLHVTVWTQQGGDGGGGDDDDTQAAAWPRTSAFRIPTAVPCTNVHLLWDSNENWFNFSKGSMLVLYRSSGVFILDLEKKVMEKAMDLCFLGRHNHAACVAYEMDLVEFFTLQLGGLRDGLRTSSKIES